MDGKWKKRLSYTVVALFFFMGGVEYAVILPTLWLYIKTDFHAENYMLGMLLSAFSFAAIVSGPVLGRWSDRFRRPKLLLLIGALFEVSGNIMYFMGISIWFLLASRLVAGIGGGAEAVLLGEVTRCSEESKRTSIISSLIAVRQFGLLVGPGLNLFLREMNFDVDGFNVNKYNVPGAFMACVWLLQFLVCLLLYTDLHKLQPPEHKQHTSISVPRSQEDGYYGNSSRVTYDEDLEYYKEVDSSETFDRKSINSAASSRSPINDPDNLIETADRVIEEGQRSRSQTPASIYSFSARRSSKSDTPRSKTSTSADVDRVAMETGYGTFGNNLAPSQDDRYSYQGSQDYISSREESLKDYLQGRSKVRFMYHEYIREEIVTVIAVQFISFFNQVALETMVTPLAVKLLHWGELENSIMYCLAGLEIIVVFGLVMWLSRRLQDRVLIVMGTVVLTVANIWLIYVIPQAEKNTGHENLWKFVVGIALDVFALPPLASAGIALYSKITRKETQGLSMGLRRSVVGIATILGPLWAGSTINIPYVMLGAMLGLLFMSLVMLLLSYSKLTPASEQTQNKAGLITAEESCDDDNTSQPLLT